MMKLKHLTLSAAAAVCMFGGSAQAATVPSFTFPGTVSFGTGSLSTAYDAELVNTGGNMIAKVTLNSATPITPSQTIQYAVYQDTNGTVGQVSAGGSVTLTPGGSLVDQSNQDAIPFFTFLMQAGQQYVLELTGASSVTGSLTTVSAVPLPGALWLFGSALLGFLGFSNRRKI